MNAQEQAFAYARAIYESALESWIKQLSRARVAYEKDASAQEKGRSETASERLRAVDAIVPKRTPKEVRNFLSALAEKGQLDLLGEVVVTLAHLARQGAQPRIARITSATPLTDEEKGSLRANIQDRFGSDLEFDFHVDPSIIGGVIVQVGDRVIDGSVAARLTQLKATLLDAR